MITVSPYKGYDNINFKMSYDEVRTLLQSERTPYNTEHWPNKGCTPEVAWDIIRIGASISLFFAKGRMFKIYFENSFDGKLENGICIGMPIKEAESIDSTLEYDDWNESYASKQGYWLEDDAETGKIISISIFIKALENEETFFQYKWCKN